jgi:hypothetical protein
MPPGLSAPTYWYIDIRIQWSFNQPSPLNCAISPQFTLKWAMNGPQFHPLIPYLINRTRPFVIMHMPEGKFFTFATGLVSYLSPSARRRCLPSIWYQSHEEYPKTRTVRLKYQGCFSRSTDERHFSIQFSCSNPGLQTCSISAMQNRNMP